MEFPKIQILNFQNVKLHDPTSIFGVQKTHNVATKLISYKRYGEILFQKVASGYLLHFAQDVLATLPRIIQKL